MVKEDNTTLEEIVRSAFIFQEFCFCICTYAHSIVVNISYFPEGFFFYPKCFSEQVQTNLCKWNAEGKRYPGGV